MKISQTRAAPQPPNAATADLVIVGAGFGGMYMLHRARGLGLSAVVFETADDVGGTWYWNRYPGARCDVESIEYSFSFSDELQQHWRWSERYATQPEILRYAKHVADRFELRRDIRFNTRVKTAAFNDATGRWTVTTDTGDTVNAQFVVMATGPLSATNTPPFPGAQSFEGDSYHTGAWPHHEVDFTGKRVGIIGTGSSAVQAIPLLAKQAKSLHVFQRTAAYAVPARNGPMNAELEADIRTDYPGYRARNLAMPTAFGSHLPIATKSALEATPVERRERFEAMWQLGGFAFGRSFTDLVSDSRANEMAAQFIRDKIAAIVLDPAVAKLLSPTHPVMCKRLCVDSGYFETFNRESVHLVDISTAPIEEITPRGLRAGDRNYEFDSLIYATGFDAMTGTLLRIDIRGREGLPLKNHWDAGPRNYLGLTTAGFPNLFMLVGPGSPSALTNVLMQIEQHVQWVAECIAWMRAHGKRTLEASADAEQRWVEHVHEMAARTVYPGCNSWYSGANIPGKPRMFMALLGFPPYARKCEEVAANGYEGFEVTA